MKMQDLFPSKYLRAADLQGKPRTVTIERVTHETFKDDGEDVTKAVLHFSDSTRADGGQQNQLRHAGGDHRRR